MYHSLTLFIVLLSLFYDIQGFAPEGCQYYDTGRALCDFQKWIPPVHDDEFGPEAMYFFGLTNINGTIPAGAFCGLDKPLTNRGTILHFFCVSGGSTRLSHDIFTKNLHWVMNLMVDNCLMENGLPRRLLENLKSLKYLSISGYGSVIEGLVAHDALAGLGNLLEITIRATVSNGRLTSGFFSDLKNITYIDLRYAALNFIPANWFYGLVNLEKIYLSNNNLQTLPQGIFDRLHSLTNVWLDKNPWTCSCELMWMQHWSNITVGAICQSPTVVKNIKFEHAFGLLDCTTSTSTVLSPSVFLATEITETQTPSVTFAANSSYYECIDSTSTPTKAMPSTSATIRNILTATPTPETTIESTVIITSTTITEPSSSCRASTTDETEITKCLSSLSIDMSSRSTFDPTLSSAVVNEFPCNTVLITTASALTVFLVVVAVLYRNKYFGRVNRVHNGEEGRQVQVPHSMDRQNSFSRATI